MSEKIVAIKTDDASPSTLSPRAIVRIKRDVGPEDMLVSTKPSFWDAFIMETKNIKFFGDGFIFDVILYPFLIVIALFSAALSVVDGFQSTKPK